MISFKEAEQIVLRNLMDLGKELVPLENSVGRVLAEKIYADRDFPPFDRVTKDGIAIRFQSYENGNKLFKIQETAAAGSAQVTLSHPNDCIEVMTGAMLPKGTDTVIMYENLLLKDGNAIVEIAPQKSQDVHSKGSDEHSGSVLLDSGNLITPAEIGVLATVGKSEVKVKKLPKIAIVSTGDELVNIDEIPEPHQIRKSNSWSLKAALKSQGIIGELLHFRDSKEALLEGLGKAIDNYDVLLLSGGVSKGKFDYLPEVLEKLGVKKLFHRVLQRPGKPFWFGLNDFCTLFAFPGNPASTFANFHVYFLPWLRSSFGAQTDRCHAVLNERFENTTDLTRFILADAQLSQGTIKTNLVKDNGSGDLTSLARSNGLICFDSNRNYEVGELVPFYPTKKIL
ncbi:molybdopterin molybdotransferase MoeA [Croceivirga thetidis]|uniref:Molybdopterin molybdenumtransferase n=1 Tax=Croceivirga thetidis TaxID=2721623 RepID=A0ABX1GQU4_9FLAO|nr:molybdopterin molybdotransferase MoeA [Croceivirga thetidis]NKI32308.1 molybdopterin molybdotransferase MoeA [Croceivirga thetidis]